MEIIPFIYQSKDELASNAYIAIDSDKQCIVVDPGCDYEGLVSFIAKNNLKLKGVLLTHSHFDHIRGVDRLIDAFRCPLYCHRDDIDGLTDEDINLSYSFTDLVYVKTSPTVINDGDILNLLNEPINVIHTPYHTIGSVCYYLSNSGILFSGDTLFKFTIGRADLITSVKSMKSVTFKKLTILPDTTKVYPGHGPSTTIGYEKEKNPFIKR